jgi:hypothetical protein
MLQNMLLLLGVSACGLGGLGLGLGNRWGWVWMLVGLGSTQGWVGWGFYKPNGWVFVRGLEGWVGVSTPFEHNNRNSLLKHFCEKSLIIRASTTHGVKWDDKDLRSITFDQVDRDF